MQKNVKYDLILMARGGIKSHIFVFELDKQVNMGFRIL